MSGHSTFSRAAAEILTAITGDPFFPGRIGCFPIVQNEFLVFEDGPSASFDLQWATYRDASDQCSLSRIWGGIHPPADDFPGRQLGKQVAEIALERAEVQFGTVAADLRTVRRFESGRRDWIRRCVGAVGVFRNERFGTRGDLDNNGTVGVDDILAMLVGLRRTVRPTLI